MNIWVIGRSYPQVSNNMKGSFELEQAKMLARDGNNVSYLAAVFHPYKRIKKWGYCDWNEEGVHIFTASYFSTLERFRRYVKKYQEIKWRAFLKEAEYKCGMPDVIHVHYPAMITIPNVILDYQKKNVKVVVTEHWTKVLTQKLDDYECKQLTNYINNADVSICVGAPLKDAIKNITKSKKKIEIIPNIVSNLFMPDMNKVKDNFEFIAVGRLVEVKQFDKIIKAFIAGFKNVQSVKLTIVGGGTEYSHLKEIINKHHMEKQIILTGGVDKKSVAEQLKRADVLICYSRLETFGVPVIEAWASGIPVIASNALGLLEYWKEGLGYIVPWDDINALKMAMTLIHDNIDRFDKSEIAKIAKENFSEQAIMKQLRRIYE